MLKLPSQLRCLASTHGCSGVGIISGAATSETVREDVYTTNAGDFDLAVVIIGGGNKEEVSVDIALLA